MKDGKVDYDAMDFIDQANYLSQMLDKQENILFNGILSKFQEFNDMLVESKENF